MIRPFFFSERGVTGSVSLACSVAGCERRVKGRGYCEPHLRRVKKYGNPQVDRPVQVKRRGGFWDKADRSGSCWVWTAAISPNGYGHYNNSPAHRVAYELVRGPIPAGLQIDHLCRNRACVNPAHLEAVTPQVNVLRSDSLAARNARKTHCPQGHPLPEQRNPAGARVCRPCKAAEMRRRRARTAA